MHVQRPQSTPFPASKSEPLEAWSPSLLEFECLPLDEEANDQAEQSEHGTENFNNQDLNEPGIFSREREEGITILQCRISSVGKRCTASVDAYGHAADEIAHADCKAGPKESIASEVV